MNRLLLFFTFFAATLTFGQQDVAQAFFWSNYTQFNPAATGLFYRHEAAVIARNQYVGVNGAPETYFAHYNAKVRVLHGGIGFNYTYDKTGFNNEQYAMLNYSYQAQLKENHVLSFGLSAGIVHSRLDKHWIPPNTYAPTTDFDVNFGLMYKNEHLLVGLSSTHIVTPKPSFSAPAGAGLIYNTARHYYLTATYRFDMGLFALKPQVLVRTELVLFSADLNLLATYNNRYWLGLTYRTSGALGFMGGWDIKERYRIGYAYELSMNKLSTISKGSHEIVLGFLLQ